MDYNKKCVLRDQRILKKLKDRNAREKRYTGILQLCNSLHESVDFLQKENARFHVQNAKLLELQKTEDENVHDAKPDTTQVTSETTVSSHEKKIYELQQELMDLHKNKGAYAEEAIQLKKALDQIKDDIVYKTKQVEDRKTRLEESTTRQANLEEEVSETNRNLQLVKDEYAALSITYMSLQKSNETLKAEHKDLVERWKVYEAEATEDIEKEGELVYQLKTMRIQKELADAVKEPEVIEPGPSSRKSFLFFRS